MKYLIGQEYKKLKRILFLILLVSVILLVMSEILYILYPLKVIFNVLMLPFVISLVLYYVTLPLNMYLRRRIKIKYRDEIRSVIILMMVVLLGSLFFIWLGPIVKYQSAEFMVMLPDIIDKLTLTIVDVANSDVAKYFKIDLDINLLNSFIEEKVKEILIIIGSNSMSIIGNVSSSLMSLFLAPFLTFYMLKDFDKFKKSIVRIFHERKRREVLRVIKEMDNQLASYVQGQLIVSLFVGVFMYIGFMVVDLRYALLLSLIVFLTNFVPFIGPIIGSIPALVVALINSPLLFLKVLIIILVVQQIESWFVSPQVMGKKLKVHPITVIVLLLVAGRFFGFLGMLFALPVYVLSKVIVSYFIKLWVIKKKKI